MSLFLYHFLLAQENCDCNETTEVTLCYVSNAEYCSNGIICEYALDGNFMTGLNAKLNNPALFGENGISNCNLNIKPLSPVTGVQSIYDDGCEMVFVCSFAERFGVNDISESSAIPDEVLQDIKSWSLDCERNIAIVTQGEARAWGYTIRNENVNPNIAVENNNFISLFDGIFGSVETYNQGGTYQGVIIEGPETGFITLGNDAAGKPGFVVDSLTNDLILGDIGIFCSGGAGSVSESPNVNNANDILVSNIFTLSCQLAIAEFSFEDYNICSGDSFELPGGDIVFDSGTYIDTLETTQGCDSIVETTIVVRQQIQDFQFYDGCSGDGYQIDVDGIVYDESNPTANLTLLDEFGCDSLVNIDLVFKENSEFIIEEQICGDQSIEVGGITFNSSVDTTLFLRNSIGCDSVINLKLESYSIPYYDLPEMIRIENNMDFVFDNYIENYSSISWVPELGLSCYDCLNPTIRNSNVSEYTVEIKDNNGCTFQRFIKVEYVCTPYIPNVFSVNAFDRNNVFAIQSICPLENYELEILDRWGNLVFKSNDILDSWNGKFENKNLIPGVYVYKLSYAQLGENEVLIGSVTLIE